MTDRICIQRIAVYGYHGVLPEERALGQRFYISLDCRLDLSKAGKSDDYTKTVGYQQLTTMVRTIATEESFQLIEALAEAIAEAILSTFPTIESMLVRVEKPAAPIAENFETVFVEIHRRQEARQ